jgi:hypothetical protein
MYVFHKFPQQFSILKNYIKTDLGNFWQDRTFSFTNSRGTCPWYGLQPVHHVMGKDEKGIESFHVNNELTGAMQTSNKQKVKIFMIQRSGMAQLQVKAISSKDPAAFALGWLR